MHKVVIGVLVLCVLWFGWRPVGAAGIEGHWAGKDIDHLVKQNILVGNANGAIDPDGVVRRGEFVASFGVRTTLLFLCRFSEAGVFVVGRYACAISCISNCVVDSWIQGKC
jgi:hypothetical protein